MKYRALLSFLISAFIACTGGKNKTPVETEGDDVTGPWKLGVALWTFHTVDLPSSLRLVDSTGLNYIEPNTFHRTGPEFKDSTVLQLSSPGIDRLKELIDRHGLKAESIYIAGDSTLASWIKQFDIAHQLGVKFVTAEPPVRLWNSIDSIAGAHGIKVAIHEHWKGVSPYWNPDTVLMAIKDHPNFGACADLGHWPKSGIDPVDAIRKLRGQIISIHLKDIAAFNDPSLKDVRVGTGVVNFPAVFEELKKQNFNGHIYIERDEEEKPNNLESVREAIAYYKEQIKKLQP